MVQFPDASSPSMPPHITDAIFFLNFYFRIYPLSINPYYLKTPNAHLVQTSTSWVTQVLLCTLHLTYVTQPHLMFNLTNHTCHAAAHMFASCAQPSWLPPWLCQAAPWLPVCLALASSTIAYCMIYHTYVQTPAQYIRLQKSTRRTSVLSSWRFPILLGAT